jgi:hypothetical protein
MAQYHALAVFYMPSAAADIHQFMYENKQHSRLNIFKCPLS